MNLVSIILLLASISTISSTVAGQCDYVYIAQPPRPELICNPHAINQLRLVCSIFVADISQPDNLTVQWIFGVPTAEGQFDPNNLFEFRQASINFTVVPREIFTSRLEVVPTFTSLPIGFYFCFPSLSSGRPLRFSNIVPLQPQSVYQQNNTRPCLPDEFQNTSTPSCAVPGATIDPSQILAPVPMTVIDILQIITPTVVDLVTPTALLEVQQTPAVTSTEAPQVQDKVNIRLIAGVVVGSIAFVVLALVVIPGVVILLQARKNNRIPLKLNDKRISITKIDQDIPLHTLKTYQGDEEIFVPPNKPPPTLISHTRTTTNHHYSRLIRSRPKTGRSSERSAGGSELDYNEDEMEYYTEFDDEHMENPYVDESESLVYTDAHYSAESDFHLQQQQLQKQRKQQSFVRSTSLELESHNEGIHAYTREAGNSMIPKMARSPQHDNVYQNCIPQSVYDNARLRPTSKKAKSERGSASYDQEDTDNRELETEYANAEMLEKAAI